MPKTGYADIAAEFRRLIADGQLSPGDALPSQRDVIKRFGVSVTTANRAFALMKTEGLIVTRPGVGTVVADQSRTHVTGAGRLARLARTSQPYGAGETSVMHQAGIRSIDDVEIADLLGVELRDEVVVRTRVFLRDGSPRVYASSVIHIRALSVVPELASDEPLPKFWQLIYKERTGQEIVRSPERRGARLATEFELGRLQVVAPPNAAVPVLVLQNVFHDEDGRAIEVWEDVYAPGIWQVSDS